MKSILLTGSGGFIGKNLKEFLQNKFNLLIPRSYELDLTDSNAVNKYFFDNEIDFIVHCSTIGGVRDVEDPEETENKNFLMVENLINAKNENVNIILFGSGAQYDKSKSLHKVKESEFKNAEPKDLYGKSKKKIAELALKRNDLLCLNVFGCYGKYEKESRFPTYAITQNLKHQPIEINQNVVFDYLYVEDLCKIIEYFINNNLPCEKVINATPSESISLIKIAEIINQISDFKSDIIVKKEGFNCEYTGDNSLLKGIIPDIKFSDYKSGLNKLYYTIKENLKIEEKV